MISRGLFWCAGADERRMGDNRTERARYLGIGSSVLLTSCAAVFAMVMFVRLSVPGPWPRDLAFGLFWGLFVFTIDRWLVSSVHYGPLDDSNKGLDRGGAKKYAGALGRLLMAVFLASIISGPIILQLFGPEIDKQLSSTQTVDKSAAAGTISDRADFVRRRTDITAALRRAEQAEKTRDAARSRAQKDVDDETSGKGGSGRAGCDLRPGIGICWQKKEALKTAEAAAGATRSTADAARKTAARDTARLEADIDAAVAVSNDAIGGSGGALAREEALFQLLRAHPELWIRWALISGLFMLVDLMPVVLKLFGPATLHDRNIRLAAVEQAFADDRDRRVERAGVTADQDVRLHEIELDKQVRLKKAELRQQEAFDAAAGIYAATRQQTRPPAAPEDQVAFRLTTRKTGGTTRSQVVLNNRWALEGRLAEGGFGDVYLARDLHHHEKEAQ